MSVLYRIFISERKIFLLLSFGALVCGLFLFNKYLSSGVYSHFWWKCWLLSIAFFIIAFSNISPSSFLSIHKKTVEFVKEFFHLHFQKIGYLAAFLLIIVSGIFFRLYRLDCFPWGLEGLGTDTAYVAEYALRILGGIPYTPVGNSITYTIDTLPYYYIAPFFSLFGSDLFILRCAALSVGIINIVLTYFVIKSVTNNIVVSLAGMALLTFSAADTVLNYSAYELVVSTPILLSSFLFLSLAIKDNRSVCFIIAGLCFGLGLSSSRHFISIAPAIILMFIHHAGFNLRRVKSLAKGMAFFFLAVFYVVSPKIIYLLYYHTAYFSRVWDVTTVDSAFKEGGIIGAVGKILSKIKPTFTLLFSNTDTIMGDKWLLGNTPIIDHLVLPLFIVGIIYAIVKIKNYKYFFLLCYLVLSVLMNASSYPSDYRFITFMPLPYIMAALALNLTNHIPKFKRLLYVPAGIYLLLIILFNVKIYYSGMGVNPERSLYRVGNVIMGKYLRENPPDKKTYVALGKYLYGGSGIEFFSSNNRGMPRNTIVDFFKLAHGVPWRGFGKSCNNSQYSRILSNVYKIINENKNREEGLCLIFDDAPCHEEVVLRLESVFKKSRSVLSLYSKSCKRNLIYLTFELGKDELMQMQVEEKKRYPALKEGFNDKLAGGIMGKYYEGIELTKLVSTRADKEINFHWGLDKPHPLLPADDFSVRWDGFIRIDKDGEYRFITESDDGVRLWIDGNLVIDNWTDHALEEDMGRINLVKGWHNIRLEYYEDFGGAVIKFGNCKRTDTKL